MYKYADNGIIMTKNHCVFSITLLNEMKPMYLMHGAWDKFPIKN